MKSFKTRAVERYLEDNDGIITIEKEFGMDHEKVCQWSLLFER